MEEPKSLDVLFEKKIFRIPDYQRGYAWRREQLKDFWEDLVNLSGYRSHYTGVLTLKQIPVAEIANSDNEHWLVTDHSYNVYHIVDGQQRLTTFIIFLQAFVNIIKALPENRERPENYIYVTGSFSIADLQSLYLFKIKPTGDKFRTYKFGYTEDNPSYHYLRFRILDENSGGTVEETFYTLNLNYALEYFSKQIRELYELSGIGGLEEVYKKLTKRFLFNEYVIKDEFDVFVAFETMNNRGKKLSDLELLKNRLIYLTTLYEDSEVDVADRKSLRDNINGAWKEIYRQLGRKKERPLNDDDFLRAHWVMYFKYSRKTGHDYIKFLLDEQFTPNKIHKKIESKVFLEAPEEIRVQGEIEEAEDDNGGVVDEPIGIPPSQLAPTEIGDYVRSLKESAVHWSNSFFPELADRMSTNEQQWIKRLNRVGMTYFRPLIMSILKSQKNEADRIDVFIKIERYIFIVFRTTTAKANYGDSEFYNAARPLDRGEISLADISAKLELRMAYAFEEDRVMRISDFYNILLKKFKQGSGYYGWSGLRYFLFEYETQLLVESRQPKVDWSDLLKSEGDKVSIEHIYPQTETKEWESCFVNIVPEDRRYYKASLGNLLLLSMSINSSLQNDSFENKKAVKFGPNGEKLRNGYRLLRASLKSTRCHCLQR